MTLTEKYKELAQAKADLKVLTEALQSIEGGITRHVDLSAIQAVIDFECHAVNDRIEELDEEIMQAEADLAFEDSQEFNPEY